MKTPQSIEASSERTILVFIVSEEVTTKFSICIWHSFISLTNHQQPPIELILLQKEAVVKAGFDKSSEMFILNIYLNKINISRELSDEIMEEVNLLIPHKAHLAPLVPTCCLKRLNYICYLRPLDYSSPKSSL